ncbi:hypothetical protein LDR44_001286 [Salmonella enterica]|uniref:Uncharacterized protein n=1 Tax=Salmonella enterica TaxID=28901 RepID=A0A5U6SIM5_SALER|nr:hypothetical protein [Salmonella enterica]EIE7702826.1 hypothetical protein [Salmonella enterica]EIN2105783.1 hypothetical protein [Salmonella enterica]EIO8761798.1 hypothetical protein [Salmonella enterica]EIO8780299.1 hypothetical protein [Salmonella enterica]
MKKDELKHFRKGIKDVQRMLTVAAKRLNDGRCEAAAEFMMGEAALLQKLATELRSVIEDGEQKPQ